MLILKFIFAIKMKVIYLKVYSAHRFSKDRVNNKFYIWPLGYGQQ